MRRSALLLMLLPLAVQAAPKDDLVSTQEALKAAQTRQAKIAAQQAAVERDLEKLQQKLIRAAAALQKNDAALDAAEKKIQQLEQDVAQKEKDFAAKRAKLDGLSRIAIRLSRTPPQAMVLMPADGKDRLQAAQALALVTSEIKIQATNIQKEMEALGELKAKVQEDKARFEKARDASREEKKSFEAALKARKTLRDKLAISKAQEESKVAELAKKAGSLQELINSLNNRPRKQGAGREVVSDEGISGSQGRMRDFESAKGRIRLPVSGKLTVGYGERDGGEASKGLKIAAREGGTVVASFDAEVAYSGTFLNYGKLVILKHRGDYHTLLAGLSRIDVKTGDFLLEGEPIGAMGSGENRQLYVELREHNQPVNPEKWMRGL